MTRHHSQSGLRVSLGLCSLLAVPALLACSPSLAVPEANRPPIAEARVEGKEGDAVVLDYMGAPLRVVLDGSFSRDVDGSIKTYRWLSGTRVMGSGAAGSGGGVGGAPAAGSGAAGMSGDDAGTEMMPARPAGQIRWVPAGETANWPADEVKPSVMLSEGVFTFELWVIDEKNAVSEPSTLEITVRTPLSPEVQTCVDNVFDTVAPACKTCVCSASEQCRTLSVESVCDQNCWALLSCIGSRCPTFMSGGDTSCLVAMCSSSLGGATGAGMIAPCLANCREACRSR